MPLWPGNVQLLYQGFPLLYKGLNCSLIYSGILSSISEGESYKIKVSTRVDILQSVDSNQHLGILRHLQDVDTFEVQTPFPLRPARLKYRHQSIFLQNTDWGLSFARCQVVCRSGDLFIGLTVQCTICSLFFL